MAAVVIKARMAAVDQSNGLRLRRLIVDGEAGGVASDMPTFCGLAHAVASLVDAIAGRQNGISGSVSRRRHRRGLTPRRQSRRGALAGTWISLGHADRQCH